MKQFKVIRTDGWNENIVGTFNTEQSARKPNYSKNNHDECGKLREIN